MSTTYAVHLKPGGRVADYVAVAREAEAAGVDSVYGIEAFQDPFVPLAAIAAATSRVRIGSYVANAYAREPQAAASAALNLDELSGGRFLFGIGAGNRHINEWLYGVETWKPMQKMREYLEIVGAMLRGDTSGKTVLGGSHHRMQARLVSRPDRPVPFVVAAAGPRMIELAATMSDGVGCGILISPEYLAGEIRPRAVAAAESAGVDAARLRFPMAAMVNVHQDAEQARRLTRRAIAGLFHPVPHPYYDFLLRAQGYGDVADACSELAPRKRWDEAMESIDDGLMDRLTITGTPQQCADRLHRYEGIADEVICLNGGSPPGASERSMFDVMALAREGTGDHV